MKAMLLTKYGKPEVLQLTDLDKPKVSFDEVLIRVHATSVNPLDCKIRSGVLKKTLEIPLPYILGFDVSGEIEKCSPDVKEFKPGDQVFGLLDLNKNGANAKYTVCRPNKLAYKPKKLTHAQSASMPMTALTALQALVDIAGAGQGERLLILGASGGVGSMAVQIAKVKGLHVTGMCSSKNASLVKDLGADEAVPYDTGSLKTTDNYDIIFDVVGTYGFIKMSKHLTKEGRYVTTLPQNLKPLGTIYHRIISFFGSKKKALGVLVRTSRDDLTYLANLADEGLIKPLIEKQYSLEKIWEAHRYSESNRVRGKLVVVIE